MRHKYLIQTINGKVVHDFAWHLIQAIEHQNWFYNEEVYKYQLTEQVLRSNLSIPVGSLQYVFDHLSVNEGVSIEHIVPINIPLELQREPYLKRTVRNLSYEDIYLSEEMFIKSASTYKSIAGIFSSKQDLPLGNYMISEVIEIDSEWRAFVHQGEMVGLKQYAGELNCFPHVETIEQMIKDYDNAPMSYTLDVGINKQGTFVMEVHPFVSCGLYGFQDPKRLPVMLSQGYHYMKKEAIYKLKEMV